jgi:hypothetical protein
LPKKKGVKIIHSETKEDSAKENDANKNFNANYADNEDMHNSDSDLALLVNRLMKPPIKKPVCPAFFYVMCSENSLETNHLRP